MMRREDLEAGSGPRLHERAHRLIPGGTQLFSKRPELFAPGVWPSYYSRAKGVRVWDLDGREFLDMSIMSVGACILGYADEEVDEAVRRAVRDGVASSLNCPEEVELADLLVELHPWFDRVRLARSGGEAMSIAVRIARATTGRDLVLFSGYHGWSDWYLAANLAEDDALSGHLMPGLAPAGVPRALRGTAIPFAANDIEAVRALIRGREQEVAAVIIEPARGEEAPEGFLQELSELSHDIGALLVFDEITSGYRVCAGGMHRRLATKPDMAVLAKAMANGYAMAAVLGTGAAMSGASATFISSTNWTERIGPSAAVATTRKYLRTSAEVQLARIGSLFREALPAALSPFPVSVTGLPSLVAFSIGSVDDASLPDESFTIAMLRRGILAFRQFKPSAAHRDQDVHAFMAAATEVAQEASAGVVESRTERQQGPFARLTRE